MLVVGALKRPWRCRTDMVRQRSHAVRSAGQVTAGRWHHDARSCTCVNAVRSMCWGLFLAGSWQGCETVSSGSGCASLLGVASFFAQSNEPIDPAQQRA